MEDDNRPQMGIWIQSPAAHLVGAKQRLPIATIDLEIVRIGTLGIRLECKLRAVDLHWLLSSYLPAAKEKILQLGHHTCTGFFNRNEHVLCEDTLAGKQHMSAQLVATERGAEKATAAAAGEGCPFDADTEEYCDYYLIFHQFVGTRVKFAVALVPAEAMLFYRESLKTTMRTAIAHNLQSTRCLTLPLPDGFKVTRSKTIAIDPDATGSPFRLRNSQSHVPVKNVTRALFPHTEYRVANYLAQTKVCPNGGRYIMLVVASD